MAFQYIVSDSFYHLFANESEGSSTSSILWFAFRFLILRERTIYIGVLYSTLSFSVFRSISSSSIVFVFSCAIIIIIIIIINTYSFAMIHFMGKSQSLVLYYFCNLLFSWNFSCKVAGCHCVSAVTTPEKKLSNRCNTSTSSVVYSFPER